MLCDILAEIDISVYFPYITVNIITLLRLLFLQCFDFCDMNSSLEKINAYPGCACALCRAAWDHADVLGSNPAIGKAVNAEGGNCNGSPFLSNILLHWFRFFYTDVKMQPLITSQNK